MALSTRQRALLVAEALDRYVHDHHAELNSEQVDAIKDHARECREYGSTAEPPSPPPVVAADADEPPDTPPNPDTPPPNDGGGSGGNSGSGGGGGD